MDVREYIDRNAPGFFGALREWPAGHLRETGFPVAEVLLTRECGSGPEADLADILRAPPVFPGVGLDEDRIHAPDEKVTMALLRKGAEAAACRWEELAARAGDRTAAR